MALEWGGWHYAGNNGMRVGIDAHSGSGVSTDSGSFTFYANYWTGNQYNYNDNMTLSYTGGSLAFNNTQATGTSTQRVTNAYYVHNYSSWGPGSGGSYGISCSISGAYNGSTPSHTVYVGIPERPYAAPYGPGSVTATRTSDTSTTVSFTNPANAQRPVSSFTIQMSTYTGAAWSGYVDVYTGGATSVAIATGVNHSYLFQVRCNGPAGSSGYVAASGQTYTTPSAPATAAAVVSGPNVIVTWTSSAYTSGTVTHKVERKIGTGAWVAMASGIAQGTKTWTDTAPGGGTNYYRVATVTSAHGGLSSSWTQANSVVTADCWVWDGEAAIPAHMTLWNGSAELPLSVDTKLAL